jgi:hypothetical protein
MKKYIRTLLTLFFVIAFLYACKKEDSDTNFKNDFIKQTVSPAIVGESLEFKYALGTISGKLSSAEVTASIAGAPGTGFSNYSLYTDRNGGINRLVKTGLDSLTDGQKSTVQLVDTNAVTLRYYYVVPPEAIGKKVSFTFSGKNSLGEKVSISTPEYVVSKMQMKRLILLKDAGACYFSIEDMAAYTKEQVELQNLSGKIDFVYIYRPTMGSSAANFGHALVALSNGTYINDLSLPASWAKPASKMEKRIDNMRDAQLKGAPPTVYVDDIDLASQKFASSVDYAFGFSQDMSALVQTADGVYTSYIFINKVDNAKKEMTISIKQLKVK